MIKAIFWDNDGVLVDTEKLYYRANKETFAKMGIELSEELYIEFFLKQSLGTWHLAQAKGFNKEQIDAFHVERDELYSRLLSTEMNVITGDFTLAFGDYVKSKPAPDPYIKAIEISGFLKEECIAVEDSERGLQAALNAGINCYVIPTALTRHCNFTGAKKILNSITELPDLLL
jgi:HAD superfamily hydrolase (TIGR01509 family)